MWVLREAAKADKFFFEGTAADLKNCKESITARYL
jgi:hypothetical protein